MGDSSAITASIHSLVLIVAVAVALVARLAALAGARVVLFVVRIKALALQGEMGPE